MLRPALLSLAIAGVAVAAILAVRGGGAAGPDYALRTPPPHVGAVAIPTPAASPVHHVTRAEAQALKPLLAAWGRALRRGQNTRASAYFALPATVAIGSTVRYRTSAEVEAFLSALPCGLHLLAVGNEGRFVIGTFRLTPRPGSLCGNPGALMRIAFVVAGGKFQEWRQVAPGAPAGPDEPEPEPGALVA